MSYLMLKLRNINLSDILDLESKFVDGKEQALWARHPRISEESNLRHRRVLWRLFTMRAFTLRWCYEGLKYWQIGRSFIFAFGIHT